VLTTTPWRDAPSLWPSRRKILPRRDRLAIQPTIGVHSFNLCSGIVVHATVVPPPCTLSSKANLLESRSGDPCGRFHLPPNGMKALPNVSIFSPVSSTSDMPPPEHSYALPPMANRTVRGQRHMLPRPSQLGSPFPFHAGTNLGLIWPIRAPPYQPFLPQKTVPPYFPPPFSFIFQAARRSTTALMRPRPFFLFHKYDKGQLFPSPPPPTMIGLS